MSHRTRKLSLVLAIGAVLSAIAACGQSVDSAGSDQGNADAGDTASQDGKEDWPETIVYGLLPTEDIRGLVAQYTPLEEYMAGCLDHPFKLFPGTDYTAMVEAMRTGSAHIAKLGPFSYILAHERADAEALAVAVEGGDQPVYRSLIVTLESQGFESLADLEGKSFAFVDPASSSGHLFPRATIIQDVGITNEEIESWFSDVVYSGNHEASLVSVLNEDVDAGAIASSGTHIVNKNGEWGLRSGSSFADHPNADEFTVLAESGDIPNTVEAVHADMPDSLKQAVQSCFKGVADAESLAGFRKDAGSSEYGFVAAKDSDYDVVRDVASSLGMGTEDLLEQ